MLPFLRAAARRAGAGAGATLRTPFPAVTTLPRFPSIPTSTPPRLLLPRSTPTRPTSTPPRFFHTSAPQQSAYYRRHQRSQRLRAGLLNLLLRWASRPTFFFEVAGLGGLTGCFYLYHVEEVPVSGRRRFNVISPEFEQQLGEGQYAEIQRQFQHKILPERDARVRQVQRVLDRLIPNSGLPATYDWKVTVIDSPETNAFVIPGGKVFVFTGILPICADDDGLAAVLGHEIGHNVARHVAEQMSRGIFLLATAWIVELLWGVPGGLSQSLLQLAIDRPRSRAQESEADYIGLLMMAKSCYDPKAAVTLWQRMQVVEQTHKVPPELLSTHPSSHRRQVELEALLPQAYQVAVDADCSLTTLFGMTKRLRCTQPLTPMLI
ncbi:hypothetical protein DRE_03731 [Drechslerella stenobrocha 248]|uniref:Peptidase M48 domain-containing protein n=1 Tax=Drechslerella stenobrocha 248 TaxID=1043628 RepID=W7HU53_9PEZI|nr:hypothetical protein DRE_03731 [Drechslerella stenobrocha 248]